MASSYESAVITLNAALKGYAPSNEVFNTEVATAALGVNAYANGMVSSSMSDAALSALVLGNMGLLPNADLDTALAQVFALYPTQRGQVILNLASLLSGLAGDATYGAAARAWNAQSGQAYAYSSDADNAVPFPFDEFPDIAGVTFTLTHAQVDGAVTGTLLDIMRLTGDQNARIDLTANDNQVKGLDLDGDGTIETNGVENVNPTTQDNGKDFEIVDAYARNRSNEFDITQNFRGNIAYDGTGFGGDGVSTDGNIVLGGLGADIILGGIGNDFLVGGGVASTIAGFDRLDGGRNADFFFGEMSLLDNTDGNGLQIYAGSTTDDSAVGNNTPQDSDWLLLEVSDDEDGAVVDLNNSNAGAFALLGAENDQSVVTGAGQVMSMQEVENIDASGNLYGFLDDVTVAIGGGGNVAGIDKGADGVVQENVGIGSSAQLAIYGSDANNKLIGGYDNDLIEGGEGDDLLMGGNLNYAVNNPNAAGITDNGMDELYGEDGNDNIVFEADAGIIDGGDDTDTLWLTRESLGTTTAANASTLITDGVLRFELENGDGGADGNDTYAGTGGADEDGTADQTNYSGSLRVAVTNMESIIATGMGAVDYLAAGTNDPELNFNNRQNHFAYDGDLDIRGTDGANTLYAAAGSDVIEGREGKDKLSGGDGRDDFYFELTAGTTTGDSVDVIHRQHDIGNNITDGTFEQDFGIGSLGDEGDSFLTVDFTGSDLALPGVAVTTFDITVDGVVRSGGASTTLTGFTTVSALATHLNTVLHGLDATLSVSSSGDVITVVKAGGGVFGTDIASGTIIAGTATNGPLQTLVATTNEVDIVTPDRLIYKAYEDRSDNEGVDDDAITGSAITLGQDSYAEDLVVSFGADGTRIAEDQRYTITFDNLTTEDTVTIAVNGVTYSLQVGVSIDGTQEDDEDGVGDTQAGILDAFGARLAGFINSFMDDDTAAGSIGAAWDNGTNTLTLTQNAYSDSEETVFMSTPTVTIGNESGGERAVAVVTNVSAHEVHLLGYDGRNNDEERLTEDNVLFIGQEGVDHSRAVLATAELAGGALTGSDALVINGGVDDLIDVDHNLATDDELQTDSDDDGDIDDESNGNFIVHGDDYLIGGNGLDDITGGTGDDRVRGSKGGTASDMETVDGGKDLYAVRVLGTPQYAVETLNAYEAEQRNADGTVLDMYLLEQSESADAMIAGADFVPYFQDTLIYHQADFTAGTSRFTINLNDYIDGTNEIILDNGGAGTVSVDQDGDGDFEDYTAFTNFEHIRTVSGVGKAVAGTTAQGGGGQGHDTLILTGLSDDTLGVRYDLTNGANAGLVEANHVASPWQDIIFVDGVENVTTGTGNDFLLIDETEAAKDNTFTAGTQSATGVDTITYMNDYGDDDLEPTVTIKVETSTNTDLVEMTGGRVGTITATDTLSGVEVIGLTLNTAQGIREDDKLDVTAVTTDVQVSYITGEVRTDANNDGDFTDTGELLVTVGNLFEVETVLTDANDLLIVADVDTMDDNARSDALIESRELTIDTYLNFDKLDDLDRESVADMRANNEANNTIPEALNFEQFTFNLGAETDRVDYSNANDQIAALVAVNAETNYVLVNGDAADDYNDLGDRVDALIGVEEIVASTGESILDFTSLGQDVQVTFQFDDANANVALDRMESLIRIGDGDGNTIDGIPNFVEYYDLGDAAAVPAFATAAWTRIEGSDYSEAVFYDGSEDLLNLAGVDHRYTDDTLNLRGGVNNVSYFALETSISATINVEEFDDTDPLNTGMVDVEVTFQDGSGGALAGGGQHDITSYTGDNEIDDGIAATALGGSLKLEASQDAEDEVTFASLSDKVFLLGQSAGVIKVEIGNLVGDDALTLTGFELLRDAVSDDVYDMQSLTTVLGGLVLVDNTTDDEDTIKVQDDAVGFQAAPADTIDLGVLNNEFSFDFDILDVTDVTDNNLILIGGAGTLLPMGYDSVNVAEPAGSSATTAVLGDQPIIVTIGSVGDGDWYQVDLVAGNTYTFTVTEGLTTATVADDMWIELMDTDGVTSIDTDGSDAADATPTQASITYAATVSGTYFIEIEDRSNNGTNTATLAAGIDTDAADDGGDNESVLVGDLDLIDDIQAFDAILFTQESIASAGDTFTIDIDAGEFLDEGGDVVFTFDASADTFDFSAVTSAVTIDAVDVVATALTIMGGTAGDTITGADGDDTITGGAGADLLDGGIVPEVTEVVVVTLNGGGNTLEAGDDLDIAGVIISDAGGDVTVVAGSDADQVGSAFVAWAAVAVNLAAIETNLGLAAGDLDSVAYDALSNNVIFNFTSQAGDVAGGTVTVDDTAMATGTLTGVVFEDGTDAAVQSAAYSVQGESSDTFVYLASAESTATVMDVISNFTINALGQDDVIDLSAFTLLEADFSADVTVSNAATTFALMQTAAEAANKEVYVGVTATDAYVFVDSNDNGVTDMVIKLAGVTDVSGFDIDNLAGFAP
jgi:RTX calcium-binding nonapeptide repeat (4 copies)